jgi:DNA-binding NarL/FixJ family response regulator
MNEKHRILLCDDQELVRLSTHEILKRHSDLEVVGHAAGGAAGIKAALELLPDLVLMDVSMPEVDGFEATRRIVTSASTVKVLAYSSEFDLATVEKMLAAGARGYVLKRGDPRELMHAIRTVLAGGSYISPGLIGSAASAEERA